MKKLSTARRFAPLTILNRTKMATDLHRLFGCFIRDQDKAIFALPRTDFTSVLTGCRAQMPLSRVAVSPCHGSKQTKKETGFIEEGSFSSSRRSCPS